MRALTFDGRSLTLQARADTPAPGPGEAVIRPLRVALGGADADAVRRPPTAPDASNQAAAPPFVPGTEFVGVVERLHESADPADRRRLEGQRVVGSPVIVCGACDLCRAGLSTHCRARRILGRPGADGALAEHLLLPVRNLHAVPRELDDDRAVFAWSAASALHAAQVVRVEGRQYVTVLGDTVEGLLAAQVVARLNASVRVLGTSPDRMALCEKWAGGIRHRPLDDVGRRQDQDIVIECTGTPAGLAAALVLVRPKGTVILARHGAAARDGSRPAVNLAAVVEHEVTVIGSRGGPIAEGLALLARAEIDVITLIGRRFRLADAAAAFAAASEPGALRVLVEI